MTCSSKDVEHNRPLFVAGNLAEERINRILLDPGSAVNILPLKTLRKIGFTPTQLQSCSLMIQGFHQGGQRAMGVITLELDIQGFLSKVTCHVINAPTSYNLLLGRPWLHQHKIVASTVHQCFKFYQDGQLRRIDADLRPFATTESFYSDAQYYELAPNQESRHETGSERRLVRVARPRPRVMIQHPIQESMPLE